nr:MAG TPA: hypothetical protein [Crassvirales sp.]
MFQLRLVIIRAIRISNSTILTNSTIRLIIP